MKKLTFVLITIITAITSCHTPKDLVYQNVQHFSIKLADRQHTVLSMDVLLYNPNKYNMKLKHADLDIFINNNHLGKVNLDEKLRVPSLDTFSMPVSLDVDIKNVIPNAFQLFLNSEVTVKLTGAVRAGRHGVFITIPVNYEGKQDIREGIKW